MGNLNILLVEDDQNLGYLLRENLKTKGYSVTLADTGEKGLEATEEQDFDLCVFDVMLPEIDGFALAANYRKKHPKKPFVFLTARTQEQDKIKGFELGADDYITKPFSFKELHYRIVAITRRLRRSAELSKDVVLNIGKFCFNPFHRTISIDGEEKKLSQRESGLLYILLRNQGEYITRSEILNEVWGNDDYFTGKSMDVYITRIRKVLKPDANIEVENLYGTGYRIKYNEV